MKVLKNNMIRIMVVLLLGLVFITVLHSQNNHRTVKLTKDSTVNIYRSDTDTVVSIKISELKEVFYVIICCTITCLIFIIFQI